ncbi:MAG: hypothetical protein M3680_21515 [Myxococcota bacterium]|nr:hypothetical protein [Myxococcota bacterium]
MRSLLLIVSALALPLTLSTTACGSKGDPEPAKLKKMDFKAQVDESGRMMPLIELFDQKHRPVPVVGSYTMTLTRPDGTVLCSVTRPLAKTDYSEKGVFKATWQDASCPADPAAEQLRVNLEVKTGDQPDDVKLAREVTTPVKFIYKHLAAKADPAKPAVDATKLPAEAPLPEPAPGAAPTTAGSAAGAGSASGSAAMMGSASDAPKPEPDGAAGSARK